MFGAPDNYSFFSFLFFILIFATFFNYFTYLRNLMCQLKKNYTYPQSSSLALSPMTIIPGELEPTLGRDHEEEEKGNVRRRRLTSPRTMVVGDNGRWR